MTSIYFIDEANKSRKIGEADNVDSVMSIIREFLEQHNFKSYYINTYTIDGNIKKYDVGSHTEFFYHENFEE